MRKVLVFKHIAQENLGSLKGPLSAQGFRIRFVNFEREPEARPSLEKYQGLIVLGGWMGVYEADQYRHLKVECELIEAALKKGIPVLGICLGSQILAHVLGAQVRKHSEREVGWREIGLTAEGRKDPLFSHFSQTENVFQMHGDTFAIPTGATHLASSAVCAGQAFRWENSYGLQFHLEADRAMIDRFLKDPKNRADLESFGGNPEEIAAGTERHLARSLELSRATFAACLKLFGANNRPGRGGHGKAL